MIEIVDVEGEPVALVRYLNASRRGGTETNRLPITRARATGLPADLDAIVLASDLQGIVPDPRTRESVLLGCALAEQLDELAFDAALPPAARTAIVLAGDLYTVPDASKRGGYGDVGEVWAAFAERFAWVAGVAGNHDDVSGGARADHVHLLDTEVVEVDGLRIGGVGLIAGDPAKRGKRDEDDQLARLELVAAEGVDMLVVHEGPNGDDDQFGHAGIRALIERHAVPLTVCGHRHWERPLARHGRGQIVNVDARALVLMR